MNKILLLISFALFFSINAKSQCTPSFQGSGAGIEPDSATNLPHAIEGLPYDASVQFKAPQDTTASVGGFPVNITIEDITITSVTGLSSIPNISPFTYVPNPATGVFLGGGLGCIQITGTPAIGSAGTYPITVSLDVHFHIIGTTQQLTQPQTVSFYKIVVDSNTAAPSISKGKFDVAQNFPNPFSTKTSLSFNLPVASQVNFKVYDLVGNVMEEKVIDGKSGVNTFIFDGSDLDEGIYFYSLESNNAILTKRLIIERK